MSNKKIEIIGKTFNSEEEAREYYKADLKKRLPELKEIEGFPIGEDEDILALSDPPYYTACPNPYINEFIEKHGKPYDEETDDYHREPYIGDITEGKNSKLYKAHSYHTKVPHEAIKTYIEHYTKENDMIFDGFCGSGMTGIGAQISNRNVIISDLAPSATFLSKNYNSLNLDFNRELKSFYEIIGKVKEQYNWLYEIKIDNLIANINYSILSQVLICPFCKSELVFWDVAVEKSSEKVLDNFHCSNCNAELKKNICELKRVSFYDSAIKKEIEQVYYTTVINDISIPKKRLKIKSSDFDKDLEEKINKFEIPHWFPTDRMPNGDESRRNDKYGFTHIHHFYTKRSLIILSAIYSYLKSDFQKFFFTSIISMRCTRRMPYRPGGKSAGTVNNLNIPSIIQEYNVSDTIIRKAKKITSAFNESSLLHDSKINSKKIISTNSTTSISSLIGENTVDYIFTDPPFGSNIMYSELSFFGEAWLKIFTNNNSEAIISKTQNKSDFEYFQLMYESFIQYYKILKPNRWITVEFHNSKSSIWNIIQDAISKAGFVVSNVSVLNKKQGSFTQVTSAGSVKNDLIISAYKPSQSFEERFLKNAGEGLELDFVQEFLHQQPIRPITERTEKMLYSKMLSYYIQHGYEVRYNAKTFYQLLKDNFTEEDGYWFNAGQINSYIEYKKKMKLEGIDEIKQGAMMMFVTDEKSALVWLHNFLNEPKSFSDIHTAFTQLANIQGDEIPDLKDLLEQNFIAEKNLFRRPQTEPEHNSVIEKREKQLMRQFESILIQAQTGKKKIKSIRKEAVQLGFETCYKEKRFQDILTLANRLDKKILEENAELKEFVDAAEIMISGLS